MLLEFPTEADWKELFSSYPYEELEVGENLFPYMANHPEGSLERFPATHEIFIWTVHLQNRLAQTRWSHMMFMYYFNKGIPDDEWMISPGRKGQSVEYYPHFTKNDHRIKGMFDYYVDVFYYKLFSAWDTLGHLLNAQYELNLNKPSFHSAVSKLKKSNSELWHELNAIENSPDFREMRGLRHSATHNELLGHIGSGIQRRKDGFSFGTGSYTPSKKIRDNAIKSLDLFVATLAILRKSAQSRIHQTQ